MLKIYGVPISVHTRKALVTARLKNMEFKNEAVIPFDLPANWNEISPTGLIPAIDHNGFSIADSSAVCAYLEKLKPQPSIYPDEAKAFGRALWLERYASEVLFSAITHPLFFQNVIRPNILNEGPPDQAVIDEVLTKTAPKVFAHLEQAAEEGALGGGSLTIADIAVVSNLINFAYLGYQLDTRRFPQLAGAFDRAIKSDAFSRGFEAEAPFIAQMGLQPLVG